MRIASMIADNLEHYDYKVEYSTDRLLIFDLVIWFAGDEQQAKILHEKKEKCRHPNVKIVVLNHKINNGMDFAIMQDMSFDYIQKNYNYSVCCFQSADEVLTEYGSMAVDEWIKTSDKQFAVFYSMNNKLFCETTYAPIVFQIIRRGIKYRTNNGLSDHIRFCNETQITTNSYCINQGWPEKENQNYVVDIGYITPEIAYNKIKNWHRLCYASPDKACLIDLWNNGNKEEFILSFIEKHRGEFHKYTDKKVMPIKYEGEYKRIIDDLGIKGEYDYTTQIINNKYANQKTGT